MTNSDGEYYSQLIREYDMFNQSIHTHPSNLGKSGTIQMGNGEKFPYDNVPGGLPVYIDKNLPSTQPTGKVKFPDWKFCEFEEKDEGWALALGFATREDETVFYMINQPKIPISFEGYVNMEFDEIVLQSITERMRKDIEDKFTEDMMRACTRTVSDGGIGIL
jgi:hypothetical protein